MGISVAAVSCSGSEEVLHLLERAGGTRGGTPLPVAAGQVGQEEAPGDYAKTRKDYQHMI